MTTRPLAVESFARTGGERGAPSGGRLPLGGRLHLFHVSLSLRTTPSQSHQAVALRLLASSLRRFSAIVCFRCAMLARHSAIHFA
jgi:hypothetical protein